MADIRIRLDELLKQRNMTRYELAKRSGISYQTLTRYYKNKTSSYETDILLKMCVVLDCGIEELIEIKK